MDNIASARAVDELGQPATHRKQVRLLVIDHDHVRLFANFERADLVIDTEYLCAADGQHLHQLFGGHSFRIQAGGFLQHTGGTGDLEHIIGVAGCSIRTKTDGYTAAQHLADGGYPIAQVGVSDRAVHHFGAGASYDIDLSV